MNKKKTNKLNIEQELKKVYLGRVTVDSGQLIVVDPCYLGNWRDGEADQPGNHYYDCCEANSKGEGGEILISGSFGTGVTFTSGLGDGMYSVYAYKDADNIIKKIEIELD